MTHLQNNRVAMISKAAATLCLLLAWTGPGHADPLTDRIEKGEVVRHGIANDSPYGYIGKDGETVGIEVDLVKAVMKELGDNDIEHTITTFGALIPGTQAKRFDIASDAIYIRPERCRAVQFSQPHFMFGVGAFIKKGNTDINVSTMEELASDKSLKIGKLTGGSEDKAYVIAGGDADQITDFTDRVSLSAAVKANRIDVGFVSAMGAAAAVQNDAGLELISPLRPPMLDGKPFVYYASFAFNQENKEFAKKFSDVLTGIVHSDEYKKILQKYNVPEDVIPNADADVEEICSRDQ